MELNLKLFPFITWQLCEACFWQFTIRSARVYVALCCICQEWQAQHMPSNRVLFYKKYSQVHGLKMCIYIIIYRIQES